jgi:REP element-mobilizing transposase RayT
MTEKDHVHFGAIGAKLQPCGNSTKIKSIMAWEIFEAHQEVAKALWGGEFWTRGHYIGIVGEH